MKILAIVLIMAALVLPGMAMNTTDDYKAGVREGLALAALQEMYPEVYNATLTEIFGNATVPLPALPPAIEKVSGTVAPVHKIDGTPLLAEASGLAEEEQQNAKFKAF